MPAAYVARDSGLVIPEENISWEHLLWSAGQDGRGRGKGCSEVAVPGPRCRDMG